MSMQIGSANTLYVVYSSTLVVQVRQDLRRVQELLRCAQRYHSDICCWARDISTISASDVAFARMASFAREAVSYVSSLHQIAVNCSVDAFTCADEEKIFYDDVLASQKIISLHRLSVEAIGQAVEIIQRLSFDVQRFVSSLHTCLIEMQSAEYNISNYVCTHKASHT